MTWISRFVLTLHLMLTSIYHLDKNWMCQFLSTKHTNDFHTGKDL